MMRLSLSLYFNFNYQIEEIFDNCACKYLTAHFQPLSNLCFLADKYFAKCSESGDFNNLILVFQN